MTDRIPDAGETEANGFDTLDAPVVQPTESVGRPPQDGPTPLPGWLSSPEGSIPPVDASRRSRRTALLFALAIVGVVLIALPLLATAILNGSSGTPDIESVVFGTGGTGCAVETAATTFASSDTIRVVAQFTPDVPVGSTVTIKVSKDGSELPAAGGTMAIATAANCISGTLIPLDPGHYLLEVAVSPGSLPPIGGTFDVTP
jgi:hypothetical protein